MGMPSVTTNLSGFGSFIEKQIPDHDNYGLYIVDRKNKHPNESINQLSEILYTYWLVFDWITSLAYLVKWLDYTRGRGRVRIPEGDDE
jgi:hypothetical protein